ncbi:protein RNA-directed DNA methylation 3 [Zea mays]
MVGTRVVIRIAVGTVLEILENSWGGDNAEKSSWRSDNQVDNEAGDSGGYRGRGRGGRGQYGGRGRGRDNGWRNGDGPKWDGGDNWNATNPPSNQPWSSSGGTKSYGQNQPSTWNNSEDNKPSVGEQGDPWASKVSSTEGKGQQNDSWSSKMTSCGAEDTRGGWDSKVKGSSCNDGGISINHMKEVDSHAPVKQKLQLFPINEATLKPFEKVDLLDSPIARLDIETTTLGATYVASLDAGVWTKEQVFAG